MLELHPNREVVILAPFTSLFVFRDLIWRGFHGAQNMYREKEGAYTGEISPEMLREMGCTYVIVGHSERRRIMMESDDLVNAKSRLAVETELVPIICVGETWEERKAGQAEARVGQQLRLGLENIPPYSEFVIAYEPIWAIGTGINAEADDAQGMISFIRDLLREIYSGEKALLTRIIYGGSVKPSNIQELMQQEDIDGVLVGGASLDPGTFAQIVNY